MPYIPRKSWTPCGQSVIFCARPLNRYDGSIIEEWMSAARHLALNMQPSGLTLTFVCNANDVETANNVKTASDLVELLMKMPPLKECTIRLADDPTKADPQQLAFHLNLETTKLFKFTDLPDELQLQVLESSYLILPNPVYYLPQHDFKFRYTWCSAKAGCGACLDSYKACCCSIFHAASSSLYTCWTPTHLLPLVKNKEGSPTHLFQPEFLLHPTRGTGLTWMSVLFCPPT